MKSIHHALEDHLRAMRMTASLLYDQGIASGRTHEELQHDIKPLMDQWESIVQNAVKRDLGEVIRAVVSIEGDILKHNREIQFLQEKIVDAQSHANHLRDELKKDLKERGLNHRIQGDYSVTLVEDKVNLR